ALGGGYKSQEGTSMAAPQAAAAAALVWMKYPKLKPYQVQELLKQTAKDIGTAGRDDRSGYGLLQLDSALTAKLKVDAFEPNNSRDKAGKLPLNDRNAAALSGGADRDWYRVNAPYDGTLVVRYQSLIPLGKPLPVRISRYDGQRMQRGTDVKIGNKTVEWKVKKGVNYIDVQLVDVNRKEIIPYLLTAEFLMAEDDYEPNDKFDEAFTLAPQSQAVTGSFHHTGDKDWYTVSFTQGGTFKIVLQSDTVRIDPAFTIQKAGDAEIDVDDFGDGESERSPAITVTPGSKYYIRVHNASAAEASPVTGTYKLSLIVQTR
ncbi:S8 family serine peptidase, partial [Paenibacillus darwinianus]